MKLAEALILRADCQKRIAPFRRCLLARLELFAPQIVHHQELVPTASRPLGSA
jgi:hypothetical protein